MSLIAIGLNVLLAGLLAAALAVGFRLNGRLKALKDSHEGFAKAVADLDAAAQRAEQGLADLRAATDEATDLLADRIEKARALAAKLETLTQRGMAAPAVGAAASAGREDLDLELKLDRPVERRLGALLAAAREARPQRPAPERRREAPPPRAMRFEDDLFEDPDALGPLRAGGRR